MPRKERAAEQTRGEQLPSPLDLLRNCRADYSSPITTWAVDEAISKMAARGLCRASASIAPGGRPHISIRRQAMEGIQRAYSAANDVYRGRESRAHEDRRRKIAQRLDEAIAAFIKEFAWDIGSSMTSAVDHALAVDRAIKEYLSDLARKPSASLRRGATADFFQAAFVNEMRRVWMDETQDVPRYPNKGLLVDLAVGAWIDAKLPDHDIDRGRLHARVAKWFSAKKENCPSKKRATRNSVLG